MMLAIVVTLCAGVLAAAMPQGEKPYYDLANADEHFEGFIQEFNKKYASEKEKKSRFEIFKQNLMQINQQNADSEHTVFGITQFADLSAEEFILYNKLQVKSDDASCKSVTKYKPIHGDIPKEFNWQSKNVVTDVKNQGDCGSCWAFSITGNVEGQYAIKHGKLVSFSEQELVDCDKHDWGCLGGLMAVGMRSLIDLGGIMSEASYPYKATSGKCQLEKNNVVAVLTDCNRYAFSDEERMREVLYNVGPLSIAVSAEPLRHYKSGILNVKDCPADKLNHGVLLVGFGEENGTPFWLVKNSWGESFGINGYFKLQRNENTCNMTFYGAVNAIVD